MLKFNLLLLRVFLFEHCAALLASQASAVPSVSNSSTTETKKEKIKEANSSCSLFSCITTTHIICGHYVNVESVFSTGV